MREAVAAVVVGAGQAGLAVSHELKTRGVEHLVLERGRIGETWRGRWDSFCLVTPNWSIQLPGGAYDGPQPDGFLPRDDVVAHLEDYALAFLAPVREGVEVSSLRRLDGGGFQLRTTEGELQAAAVVLASGAYQKSHVPEAVSGFPASLKVIDADSYRNPAALPPGRVLVIGSGQTGIQIAEELHESGREVVLACGRAPWAPRRMEGRDLFWWLTETTFLEQGVADLPSPAARLVANVQASGHRGGHDLNYRVLQSLGVTLVGRFAGSDGRRAYFAPDLSASVAFGDARYAELCGLIRRSCAAQGLAAPELPAPPAFVASPPESVALDGFGAVVVTSGFRPAYAWVDIPDAFDEAGFPRQLEGASLAAPGLYFAGVHFLRKRKSSILYGVGEDAIIVAEQVAAALRVAA